MKKNICFIVVALLTLGVSVFAQPRPIEVKTLAEVSVGLHPRELSALSRIFNLYQVLDVEKSGLIELSNWLTVLNQRLTESAEKIGELYPEYKIEILDTLAEEAFIYKFRLPGAKFYRGHVFLSTGFLKQMNPERLVRFTNGLTGNIGHEFTHPKEDELVKWDWRKDSELGAQQHLQSDEMAADLMNLRLLKGANLDPANALTGLEIILGTPSETGHVVSRAFDALQSTHPEDKLRIGLLRGGLVHLRHEEGKHKIIPQTYDPVALKEDLDRLLQVTTPDTYLQAIQDHAKEQGLSPITESLGFILNEIFQTNNEQPQLTNTAGLKGYAYWLPLIDGLLKKYPEQTETEKQSILEFYKQVVDLGVRSFSTGQIILNEDYLTDFAAIEIGMIQRLLESNALLEHPIVQAWLGSEIPTKGGFHYLPLILPKSRVLKIYEKALDELSELSVEEAALAITQVVLGNRRMHGSVEIEIKALNQIQALTEKEEAFWPAFVALAHEFFPESDSNHQRKLLSQSNFNYLLQHSGEKRDELLQKWIQIEDKILADPQNALSEQLSYFTRYWNKKSYFWGLQLWALEPSTFPIPIPQKPLLPTQKLAEKVASLLSSKEWQAELRKWITKEPSAGFYQHKPFPMKFVRLVSSQNGFSNTDQSLFLEQIRNSYKNAKSGSPLFNNSVHFELRLISILYDEKDFVRARDIFEQLFRRIEKTTGQDPFVFLDTLFESTEELCKQFFNNANIKIDLLTTLKHRNVITQERYDSLLDQYLFSFWPEDLTEWQPLQAIRKSAAYLLWKNALPSNSPESRLELLKKVLHVFKQSQVNTGSAADAYYRRTSNESGLTLKKLGITVDPNYTEFLEEVREGLLETYKNLPSDAQKNALLSSIFNPNGKPLPVEYRKLVKFHQLDSVAELFVPTLTKEPLSEAEYFRLWKLLSSERSNRHTDIFFEEYVYKPLKTLPASDVRQIFDEFLKEGRVQSERLKCLLFEAVLNPYLQELAPEAGKIPNAKIQKLIHMVLNRVPDSSRFRDDLLENIAWTLELDEPQLEKFIEPLKSFNYKSISPNIVNLLSTLSILIEKLSNQEKLELVDYFQSGQGSIKNVLPWIAKYEQRLEEGLSAVGLTNFDWLDYTESFVRDAGENERLLMIEMLVGAPQFGLWYQGPVIKEKLFVLADLLPGSTKRKAFDTYLKSVAEYEHTISLSFIMATRREAGTDSGDSELLQVLETFDAVGLKHAQQASVLGIYGPEESAKLAKAKDRAKPPTRISIFQLLRKHHKGGIAGIRIRRRLGSGSIKYVVLVQFENGKTLALSIRRPFLDERIAGTLEIAGIWAKEIKNYPELAKKYDFEYYLKSLEEQLSGEVQFLRDAKLAQQMEAVYAKTGSHEGWHMEVVKQSKDFPATENILYFEAIENAVPFNKLTKADKKAVSALILKSELYLMIRLGRFDADRHMGNYLFDPVTKTIYVIDLDQTYFLVPNLILKPGDPYRVAQLMHNLTRADTQQGSNQAIDVFLEIAESKPEDLQKTRDALQPLIQGILDSSESFNLKLLAILSELNTHRIRIPLRYSMGVVKGLMILLNEEYAKEAGEDFWKAELKKQVAFQLTWGKRFYLARTLKTSVFKKCADLLKLK